MYMTQVKKISILIAAHTCGDAPDVPNAFTITEGTDVLNASYQCYQGYRLSGSQQITCLNDGKWSLPPECHSKSEPSSWVSQ